MMDKMKEKFDKKTLTRQRTEGSVGHNHQTD